MSRRISREFLENSHFRLKTTKNNFNLKSSLSNFLVEFRDNCDEYLEFPAEFWSEFRAEVRAEVCADVRVDFRVVLATELGARESLSDKSSE